MRSTLQIGISILIWSAALVVDAQPRLTDRESPIWSTEVLSELGRGRSDITRFADITRAGVVFSNDSHLIVYEVDHDVDQRSSGTTAEISKPFLLRLLVLDPASGKVALTEKERTRAQDATVLATAAGVLVKIGSVTKIYSLDLAQVHDIPFLNRNSGTKVSVSATGKTIMFNEVIQDSLKQFHSHLVVLDASTLTARYSWDESPPLYHHYSISDHGIAAVDFNNHGIVVSAFGSKMWTRVGEPSGLCASMNMPTLYSDGQLAYGCDKFIATSTDGHILMTESYASGDSPSGKTAVAQGGGFVAVSLDTKEVKKHLLTEASERITAKHIAVYDLYLRKRVLTVDVIPLPKVDYDFALSPDGSKLAVLNGRKISVYSVPVQPK